MLDRGTIAEKRSASGMGRLLALGTVLAAVTVVIVVQVLARRMLYSEDGISENAVLTHSVLPQLYVLVMLAAALSIRSLCGISDLDIRWFHWSVFEVTSTLLLLIIVPLLFVVASGLARWLSLPVSQSLFFRADGKGLGFFIALTFAVAVCVPAIEEVFWRGFVQGTLSHAVGQLPAMLAQAVLSTLGHLWFFGGFVPVFVLGLATGAWRWRRRTLVPVILAHVAVNSLYCAGHWPNWLDATRVRVATDYVARMNEAAMPADYDAGADARYDYERAFQMAVGMPDALEAVRRGHPEDWSEETLDDMRLWVQTNEKSLQWLSQGATKSYYWRVYAGNSAMQAGMPEAASVRALAFALDARIKLHAFDGQYDRMLSDMEVLHRLGGHFAGSKVLIDQLIGVSIRSMAVGTAREILAHGSPEPQTLSSLQAQLERFQESDSGTMDFSLERLVWLDAIQRMFTDDGDGLGHVPRAVVLGWNVLPKSVRPLVRPMTLQQNEAFLDLRRRETTECAEEFLKHVQVAASQTPWQVSNGPNNVRAVLDDLMRTNAFVELLGRACLRAVELPWRTRTELDALVATIAALRHKADHGVYPASLDQLIEAGYLKHVPQDPYANGPLAYKRVNNDFVLYSHGLDFDDDGGTPSKWGTGPEGGDQVFWPVEGGR